MVDKEAVVEGRYEVLTENARRLVKAVQTARGVGECATSW